LELQELKANTRTLKGESASRALRREGKIPTVLYGPETESLSLSINLSDLEKIFKKGRKGHFLYNLVVQNDNTNTMMVMIKDIQKHPLTRNFLHVDLYKVSNDRKLKVNVPVVPVGKAKGIEMGGLLQVIRRELEILAFPDQIPEFIEIDVTDIDIGDSIHVKDVTLQGDIKILADVNFTVITVVSPKTVETLEEEEEEEEKEETAEETPESQAAANA